MKKKLITFILAFLTWIIFSGQITYPIIFIGGLISLLISFIFGDMVFRLLDMKYGPRILAKKIFYILLIISAFFYDVFISAIKVSIHAFEIKPSFSPGIVKIKTDLDNIAGISILANLITLTPGTLVLDFDVLHKYYYIHWIDVRSEHDAEIQKEIIGKQEEWINNIFA